MLHRRGRHHAEIKFIRPGTNKQLRFRKEVVGGIPTITLSLKELMLSAEELQRLMNFTAKNGIKIKSNKSRKFLLLGSSVDGANDIATNILADVLCMSRYARFRVEVQGIDYS